MSSELRVNKLTSRSGVGTVTFNDSGLIITGIATAAVLDITGSATAASLSITGNATLGSATISGVLSYDDVTNVDSVGIITARSDLSIADKIIHTGDTNTAIRFPAADTVSVETAGSECLRIESSGRVKVKAGRLLVQDSSSGNSDTDGLALFSISNTGYLWNYENSPLLIATNGTERMRIDSSGNVGINKTNPQHALVVGSGTDDALNVDTQAAGGGVVLRSYDDGTTDYEPLGIAAEYVNFYIRTGVNSSSEKLRIDSSGRLLVGTTAQSLTANFVVQGQSSNAAIGGYMRLQTGTSVTDDHALGTISFGDASHNGANIQARGDMSWSPFGKGSSLRFSTTGQSQTGPQERMRIDSSGRLLIGTTIAYSSDDSLVIQKTDAGGRIGLQHSSTGQVTTGEELGRISFYSNDGDLNPSASIIAAADLDHAAGDKPGRLVFSTTADNASSPTERMRITSSGKVVVSSTTYTNHNSAQFLAVGNGSHAPMATLAPSTASYTNIFFRNPNGNVGSITTNGTATTYSTSSDYRLKENVVDIADGITRVKKLSPKRFNFIADNTVTVDGFLAHEAQTIVPEAVTGTYNEVDNDGNDVMQGIDQAKLVPLLTAALQEAIAKIETLETANADLVARVTTLEG